MIKRWYCSKKGCNTKLSKANRNKSKTGLCFPCYRESDQYKGGQKNG